MCTAALLIQCKNQIEFGQQLVENWLNNFMFNGKGGADAKRIAEYLSDHGNFKTHSKHINIDAAKKLGLNDSTKIISFNSKLLLKSRIKMI